MADRILAFLAGVAASGLLAGALLAWPGTWDLLGWELL